MAHLVRGVAQSLPHPTDKNRSLWDARDDTGPFTGPPGFNVELGADLQTAIDLRASMSADIRSIGVHPLGSGSDYTVFLQRIGVRKQNLCERHAYQRALLRLHRLMEDSRVRTRTRCTITIQSTTRIAGRLDSPIPDFSSKLL